MASTLAVSITIDGRTTCSVVLSCVSCSTFESPLFNRVPDCNVNACVSTSWSCAVHCVKAVCYYWRVIRHRHIVPWWTHHCPLIHTNRGRLCVESSGLPHGPAPLLPKYPLMLHISQCHACFPRRAPRVSYNQCVFRHSIFMYAYVTAAIKMIGSILGLVLLATYTAAQGLPTIAVQGQDLTVTTPNGDMRVRRDSIFCSQLIWITSYSCIASQNRQTDPHRHRHTHYLSRSLSLSLP